MWALRSWRGGERDEWVQSSRRGRRESWSWVNCTVLERSSPEHRDQLWRESEASTLYAYVARDIQLGWEARWEKASW